MNKTTEINKDLSPSVMPTYGRLPIQLIRGQGCKVWDVNGKEYLDALGGIAVNTLGHNHAKLIPALKEQLELIIHSSNYFHIPTQETLAKKLIDLSKMTNVFFCNSGAEANEGAIKIARKFGIEKGIKNPIIVIYENAFHGRTFATMSATFNPKVRNGFGELLNGFLTIKINDLNELNNLKNHENFKDIVAFMLEPIQCEGGVYAFEKDYLKSLRIFCDNNEILLILDEVQTGIGRTGKIFCHQWSEIIPDVMTLAKGLASGIPIGAVVAKGKASEVLKAGNHGSTFGGNYLATRAGIETLKIIEEENLIENALNIGNYLKEKLKESLLNLDNVVDIRGFGLIIAIELNKSCSELVLKSAENGLIISVTADKVIRLVPSLILNKNEADLIVKKLSFLIKNFK